MSPKGFPRVRTFPALTARYCCRRGDRPGRGRPPRPHRPHSITSLFSASFRSTGESVFTPPSPLGRADHPCCRSSTRKQIVTFLITKFAPRKQRGPRRARSDGRDLLYKDGMIRPVVAVIKSLASALSIGTGAAGGPRRPDHPDRLRPSARRSDRSCAWRRGSALRSLPPAPARHRRHLQSRRSAA